MPGQSCRGVFVTGTDTGVGKTAVAAALVRLLRVAGHRVGAYKPAASGAETGPDGPVWEDAVALSRALGEMYPLDRVCPQRFLAPLAPPIAAAREGARVDSLLLRTGAAWWAERVDLLIVEGAGGLLSPISQTDLVADLARDLGYPLLIVARLGLGTINHTLLTVEAARNRQLPVAGVILSESRSDTAGDLSIESNPQELARLLAVPILGVIRYCPGGDLLPVLESQKITWSSLAQPRKP